jgi:transposase
MFNAIFWFLCSGAAWRDLPERYGPWQSAYHWYRLWTNDGTFDRILERLQVWLNAEGLLDFDTWFVDSTNVRASLRASVAGDVGALLLSAGRLTDGATWSSIW